MGLDMYLERRLFIWSDKRDAVHITGVEGLRQGKVKQIIEEVGYWRKANAIHNWFVENVQDGEDDCKEYYVSKEQLEELLGLVNKVLAASKMVKGKVKNGQRSTPNGWEDILEDGEYIEDPTVAKELLPTQEGFFFGGTEYDQYYVEDLKTTKEILENALALEGDGDFYYQASW